MTGGVKGEQNPVYKTIREGPCLQKQHQPRKGNSILSLSPRDHCNKNSATQVAGWLRPPTTSLGFSLYLPGFLAWGLVPSRRDHQKAPHLSAHLQIFPLPHCPRIPTWKLCLSLNYKASSNSHKRSPSSLVWLKAQPQHLA